MIKIVNLSRRTLEFSLGVHAQKTATVRTQTKIASGATAQKRTRMRVSSSLRIPAGATVDKLPNGQPITEAVIQIPVIQRAANARPKKISIIEE